jgi:hypothetical protein
MAQGQTLVNWDTTSNYSSMSNDFFKTTEGTNFYLSVETRSKGLFVDQNCHWGNEGNYIFSNRNSSLYF